jgi:hypothetical protein
MSINAALRDFPAVRGHLFIAISISIIPGAVLVCFVGFLNLSQGFDPWIDVLYILFYVSIELHMPWWALGIMISCRSKEARLRLSDLPPFAV